MAPVPAQILEGSTTAHGFVKPKGFPNATETWILQLEATHLCSVAQLEAQR